ncbi:MAG: hypothetical protein IPH61_14325 [Bacteroidetes bacterium]|nr:hypothetical protein [Bacteroidota bacterium]
MSKVKFHKEFFNEVAKINLLNITSLQKSKLLEEKYLETFQFVGLISDVNHREFEIEGIITDNSYYLNQFPEWNRLKISIPESLNISLHNVNKGTLWRFFVAMDIMLMKFTN